MLSSASTRAWSRHARSGPCLNQARKRSVTPYSGTGVVSGGGVTVTSMS
jgi:hypothetical protein